MFKYELDSLDGLDESQKAFYAEKEGKFYLQVEGVVPESSIAGLKANHDQLLTEKKQQQQLAQEAEAKRIEAERLAQEEIARKSGNLEAIENSWKEKLALRETELNSKLSEAQAKNYELTVGRVAQELAGKLAKPHAQQLLKKEINERLTLDENGNIRVLDSQGKPSALTIAELENELRSDATYQDIIIISNSTGGGTLGGGQGGGAAKNPKEMTTQERADWARRDPIGFNAALNNGLFK